jgi:hypothetical protein
VSDMGTHRAGFVVGERLVERDGHPETGAFTSHRPALRPPTTRSLVAAPGPPCS